jgi:DNA-binding NtrC family response regulator
MKELTTSDLTIENMSLEDAERQLIGNTIKKNNGNLSVVASDLGITRPTLYSKIKKYGL